MASLTKEQIFKKIIQNRAYREQILAEEQPNFEQIIKQIKQEHLQKQKKKIDQSQEGKKSQQAQGDQSNENQQKYSELIEIWNNINQQINGLDATKVNISPLLQFFHQAQAQITQMTSTDIQRSNEAFNSLQSLNSSQLPDNIVAPQVSSGQANTQIAQIQQQANSETLSSNQTINFEGSSSESTFQLAQAQNNQLNQLNLLNVEPIQNASDISNSSQNSLKSLITQLNASNVQPIEEEKKDEQNQSEHEHSQTQD
ncbi:hypothetical protein TTHERM_00128920 (macronuclear) [Tetrahymena thermophila SB210]|uniref:Uncharacterized protein n=1 Tax=Tetrahymena thermophila (strain SB210) TaxID=312017 RepID=I7MED5_TETTS|nr:hypothetical protein TTHERM_00128920 [Tetrahymena thermophila SB210]EAR96128.1 hypothetical protein TTHERM_00128920 [Tetrahymena thermophila SB210]|eukprot:XP_001016373.1 hypothetical protein TTHERM_00128920 [Tetrahymena thermophila SB210]